jgi:tetratricopeptide (TPR) repeat protein
MSEYDILRDVLIIVVSASAVLAALIGGLLFFVLRTALMKDIIAEVKKHVDGECRKLKGRSDMQAGVTYWIQKQYDRAIEITKRALTEAGDVLDEPQLLFLKGNLGFYYAEKHKKQESWELKEEAVDLTKIGFDKYSPSKPEYKKPDWIDNYLFVRSVFIQTNSEREEVIQLIDEMLSRKDLGLVSKNLEESKQYALNLKLTS